MKDIINVLGALAIVISLIGLFDLFVLPSIKASTPPQEETLSQQVDSYSHSLKQAQEDSY